MQITSLISCSSTATLVTKTRDRLHHNVPRPSIRPGGYFPCAGGAPRLLLHDPNQKPRLASPSCCLSPPSCLHELLPAIETLAALPTSARRPIFLRQLIFLLVSALIFRCELVFRRQLPHTPGWVVGPAGDKAGILRFKHLKHRM